MRRLPSSPTAAARLYYVVGASGAGKDALLRYARERCGGSARVVFAHRYITRPAGAGGENHVALSAAEFAARRALGCFALTWEAHGLAYGIGREVQLWLEQGIDVVVNGSRAALGAAQAAFPSLVAVVVEASPPVIEERLASRGREAGAAAAARLVRGRELGPLADGPGLVRIRNDGPLEVAGEALRGLLESGPAGVQALPR